MFSFNTKQYLFFHFRLLAAAWKI